MAVVAIGILEPANLTVLFELKKPQPNGQLIASQMRRFVYTAGITGAMQVATLVIMTYLGRTDGQAPATRSRSSASARSDCR